MNTICIKINKIASDLHANALNKLCRICDNMHIIIRTSNEIIKEKYVIVAFNYANDIFNYVISEIV